MASSEAANAVVSTALVLAALPLTAFAASFLVSPKFDTREPAPLWPALPLIGHIISLVRERSSFYVRLFKENPRPIFTLPMLTKKIYVINSPGLIGAAMKNNDVSFDPFLIELSAGVTGIQKSNLEMLWSNGNLEKLVGMIHAGLKGSPLATLNVAALKKISEPLNALPPSAQLDIPNIGIWIRDTLGRGITYGLFGEKNPFTPELYVDLWKYEEGLPLLAQGLNFAAPTALAARKRINKAMIGYYDAHYDELDSVSNLIQQRAALLRSVGATSEALGTQEIIIPWVSSTNTVPTFMWFFLNVFARPGLVQKIRAEVESYASVGHSDAGGRTVTLNVSQIEKACPHLGASYRETLRVYVHSLGTRRVLRDTVLQDPESGREYLLCAGADVQWQTAVTHNLPSAWGDGWSEFEPERFVNVPPSEEKKRRSANIPFGGGRHLCPGRNFALGENLGFLAALALGFEVEGAWVPPSEDPLIGTAVRRPLWGGGDQSVRVRRRRAWEDATWHFVA